jgi:hypothetical protein
MSDYAYIACEVWESKTLSNISEKRLVRAKKSSTCGEIFEDEFPDSQYTVVSVKGGESFSVPSSDLFDLKLCTPVEVLCDFGYKFLKFFVTNRQAGDGVEKLPSAFDQLLIASRELRYPALKKDSTKADNRLYNDLVDSIKSLKIGWTVNNVDIVGTKVVGTLANALWYLTCHQTKLGDRGCHIPDLFAKFRDYNDHVKSHKKTPQVSIYVCIHAVYVYISNRDLF